MVITRLSMKSIILYFILLLTILIADSANDRFGISNGSNIRIDNGAIGEEISTSLYKKNGYSKLDAGKGRHGIDGLYVKRDSDGKINDIIISEVKTGNGKLATVKKGSIQQMSKKWKLDALDKKISQLEKDGRPYAHKKKSLSELYEIRKKVETDSPMVKSHLTKINYKNNGKFSVTINKVVDDGDSKVTIGKLTKHRFQNIEVDMNKPYTKGSPEWKIQKIIKSSVKKRKRLNNEYGKLKALKEKVRNQKYKPGTEQYRKLQARINKQEKTINRIEKSRPNIYDKKKTAIKSQSTKKRNSQNIKSLSNKIDNKHRNRKAITKKSVSAQKTSRYSRKVGSTRKHKRDIAFKSNNKKKLVLLSTTNKKKATSAIRVSSIVKRKNKKILVFMNSTMLKKTPVAKNLSMLKKVANNKTVMMVIEGGTAVYSILKGNVGFEYIAKKLLKENIKKLARNAFEKAVASFALPPASTVIVLVGSEVIDYTINKYEELDKRRYVGIEDLLWNVPDEIKNKITIYDISKIKRRTIFDDDIQGDSVFDDEKDGDSLFEDNTENKKSIFEVGE